MLIGLQFEGATVDGFDPDKAKMADTRSIELVVLKNRNGKTGIKIGYGFKAKYNIFEELGVSE